MEKILIGVAWPYANGPIHLGAVAGCYLSPDIFARFHRQRGNEVLMVSGSDMHGAPITVRAEQEKTTPNEISTRFHEMNTSSLDALGISFDLFTSTATENHRKVVHDLFLNLRQKGYISKRSMSLQFCPKCERFLPDRYVEGECPICHFHGARGDQCDECGNILDSSEIIDPVCKICGSTSYLKETEHYFFHLSAFQEQLGRFVSDKDHFKRHVMNFTRSLLENGLKDRPITRDLDWGVPIPIEGEDSKRIYVWFEAVCGYLSASKEWAAQRGQPDAWKDFWQDPQCRHYYFLGKDNIPFHTIIWPAMLIGYGGLNLPYDVPANQYLRLEGDQFSTSRSVAIWLPDFLKYFSPDQLRYHLCSIMPEARDSDFTWDDFKSHVNNELVATYGNFCHRVSHFTFKNFGQIPPGDPSSERAQRVTKAIKETRESVEEKLSLCQFRDALREIMSLAQFGNKFIDEEAPWKLIKEDREECGRLIHESLRLVRALALMTYPFLPSSSQRQWPPSASGRCLDTRTWSKITGWMMPRVTSLPVQNLSNLPYYSPRLRMKSHHGKKKTLNGMKGSKARRKKKWHRKVTILSPSKSSDAWT